MAEDIPTRGRDGIPPDYDIQIRRLRDRLALTQEALAEKLGVSFASVNRWENRKTEPTALAWRRLMLAERYGVEALDSAFQPTLIQESPPLYAAPDFSGRESVLRAVVEGARLTYGHLANPVFAIESSLIEPLPHQRIAVYDKMLPQSRLRFLLADDAGAGKTIMTGLYLREMIARRLINRILIVPPAGLVGNWEQELRHLFGLTFRVRVGADARDENPFVGAESDRLIISMDTLAGDRMFARLQEPEVIPYDLVVFDEAHKLSADREPDFTERKTGRYLLAEALAGAWTEDARWRLGWACQHILLLTATPHMGKRYPYYMLWRLLEPDALSSLSAFDTYPTDARKRHFIRRTKEEMVHYDGKPIYPQRISDTLSYDLTAGEQILYDETTHYLRTQYNRAKTLNRSAARLAMSIFQRRLASSTYALLRSFERRLDRLDALIRKTESEPGELRHLAKLPPKSEQFGRILYEQTADEEQTYGDHEEMELAEDQLLDAVTARSLEDLKKERSEVERLLELARKLYERGEESKFEKLRSDILLNTGFQNQKLILFTEHRDTLDFLQRRLEAIGFAGKVAAIHGGMDYLERQRQVEFFRQRSEEGGALYLIATDAAGEGINLQFCSLMVNYDIPWNPARLEQRMGRIHRYGQPRDRVVIANLVAGKTREGRVIKTLLEKLEQIRKDMGSDKVFNVVGRIFENVPLREYLEQSMTDAGADRAVDEIMDIASAESVRAIDDKDRKIYQEDEGDVAHQLKHLRDRMNGEVYRRLLPGYVRQYVERAAPLLDIEIVGDPHAFFSLRPLKNGALAPFWPILESYPEAARDRLTFDSPRDRFEKPVPSLADPEEPAIFVHPGEPFFDRLCATINHRFHDEALHGAVFVDPATSQPYWVHIAEITVRRQSDPAHPGLEQDQIIERALIGVKQSDGEAQEWPVESLLLLPEKSKPPLVAAALLEQDSGSISAARVKLEQIARDRAGEHRERLCGSLEERAGFVRRGFDYQEADLAERRAKLRKNADDPKARPKLDEVRRRQAQIDARRQQTLALLKREPDLIVPGEVTFLAHALIVPSEDPADRQQFDAQVEETAVRAAVAYEESLGAIVQDVSTPERARRANLPDWPGFDLLSYRPNGLTRAIEVKGRVGRGGVDLTENEWARACNLRGDYWLYVVFNCGGPGPLIPYRVVDPFARLLGKSRGVTIEEQSILMESEMEEDPV